MASAISTHNPEPPMMVEGSLNYLGEMHEKPVMYAYPPPAGTPEMNLCFSPRIVKIGDGRPLIGKLSLDEQGFVLLRHETAVRDFIRMMKSAPSIIRKSSSWCAQRPEPSRWSFSIIPCDAQDHRNRVRRRRVPDRLRSRSNRPITITR